MAIGSIITAARYNAMRNSLLTVLGTNNTGTDGYGQYVISDAKASTDIVDHQDMVNLYADIVRARYHQNDTLPWSATNGLDFPNTGDIIGEFAGAVGATDSSDATTKLNMGYADFESATTDIQTDALDFDVDQMAQIALDSSNRTTSWNGTITHTVTVTFGGYTITNPDTTTESVSGANHRRYFFNTGGNIQFTASLTGGSGSKDTNWSNMLANMGIIRFGITDTTASGTGTGSSIGNSDLTTSYQTIFTKIGSGVYEENDYTIRARAPSSSTLQFEITFNDDDSGDPPITPLPPGAIVGGVDENVTGSTASNVEALVADGDNIVIDGITYSTVTIPAPTATTDSNL